MSLRNYFFGGYLDKGERILHVAHRHPLVLKFSSAKTMFFGVIMPIFLYFIFPQLLLAFIIWLFVGFCGLFYHFYDWYYDAWILTNMGVIGLEQRGFWDVTATRIEYHMIEGIAYTNKGLLGTIFNYGDIVIDKLGAQTSVKLADATSPNKLERRVMKYQEQYVFERSIRDHQALKSMLSDMIAYHVQNKKIKLPKKE